MTGEGVLNEWKWPQIDGLAKFRGTLVHSANWDPQTVLKVRVEISPVPGDSSFLSSSPSLAPPPGADALKASVAHLVTGET